MDSDWNVTPSAVQHAATYLFSTPSLDILCLLSVWVPKDARNFRCKPSAGNAGTFFGAETKSILDQVCLYGSASLQGSMFLPNAAMILKCDIFLPQPSVVLNLETSLSCFHSNFQTLNSMWLPAVQFLLPPPFFLKVSRSGQPAPNAVLRPSF